MPSKRSGCRGPKLRSFFKVDHQTSRRRALGESEIPEAVAGALNKTSSTNAGRNAKRIPRAPSPVSIENDVLIEFKPFLGV